MPDQPHRIANITVGYDFKGFSARLSYLYQTDKVTFISTDEALDTFTGTYKRWDLTLQQKLTDNILIFANLTNLNERPDENFQGKVGDPTRVPYPTYTEYYGFTMDVGVRFKL